MWSTTKTWHPAAQPSYNPGRRRRRASVKSLKVRTRSWSTTTTWHGRGVFGDGGGPDTAEFWGTAGHLAEENLEKANYELLEFDRLLQSPNDETAMTTRLKVLTKFLRY